jgi:hypothetical protein
MAGTGRLESERLGTMVEIRSTASVGVRARPPVAQQQQGQQKQQQQHKNAAIVFCPAAAQAERWCPNALHGLRQPGMEEQHRGSGQLI